MKKALILLLSLFGTVSCVTGQTSETPLYERYTEYRSKANVENLSNITPDYFSESLLSEGDAEDPQQISFFLFENSIATEVNHFETFKGVVGCLTINGFDQADRPVVFSLEYINPGEAWLINAMHVIYSEEKPVTEAICPDEYGNLD